MQPSPVEIQREVEALRNIRRRSTTQGGPGTLVLDPDLPNEAAPASPASGYWTSSSSPGLTDGDSSSSSHEDGSSSERSSVDDPFHLFWVPARLHPEIAPSEFRAFLKEHARGPSADSTESLSQSTFTTPHSSSVLGRRSSLLSRQYRPRDSDGVEEERVVPIRRNRSSIYHPGPQLTIRDLQRLDELAEEASASDDPSKLRSILRRSLSLNVAPSAINLMDHMPDMEEDADSPIIVPRPGQILRRAARTKIRKPGLPGDGGGHRFGQSTRRGKAGGHAAPPTEQRRSSDMSSSDHGESAESPKPGRVISGESLPDELGRLQRPDSYTEEASLIFDAYAREDADDDESRTAAPTPVETPSEQEVVTSTLSPTSVELPLSPPPQSQMSPEPIPTPSVLPTIHQPQPQRVADLRIPTQEATRTPSHLLRPEATVMTRPRSPASETSPFLSTSPTPKKEKEKDKKGLFGFGNKSNKKVGKEKDREKEQRERAEREREEEKKKEKEKEKGVDSSFFGSLFGKKKQDDSGSPLGQSSGRDTTATLSGSKSSKSYVPPISPQLMGASGSYARYPIHVERAIYRLSHIKLANPRRPLYEQVLISNLMFWYLGVINKTQNPSSPTPGQQQGASPADKEAREREQKEPEEPQRQENEKERERLENEKEREREQQKKETAPRRAGLTKAPSTGASAGRRAAEIPVKGPQYEMQHRVIEQEYSGYGSGPATSIPVRSNSTGGVQGRSRLPQGTDVYYSTSGNTQRAPPQLPPGAMPPAATDQVSWLSSPSSTSLPKVGRPSSPPIPSTTSGPPSAFLRPRRSGSPPPHNQNRKATSINMPDLFDDQMPNAGGNMPLRSRSATVSPPSQSASQLNGKIKKTASAHAVPNGRKGRKSDTFTTSPTNPTSPINEGEDVPLALWKQQQRR